MEQMPRHEVVTGHLFSFPAPASWDRRRQLGHASGAIFATRVVIGRGWSSHNQFG
ncbi:hypothetical protein ACWD04_00770 [Streptomyces sp. NPDC002911]